MYCPMYRGYFYIGSNFHIESWGNIGELLYVVDPSGLQLADTGENISVILNYYHRILLIRHVRLHKPYKNTLS